MYNNKHYIISRFTMVENMKSTQGKYNLSMRLMHWITGGAFLFALFLGIILTHTEWLKADEFTYIKLHKSFGLLVFFLVLLRLPIRLFSELPGSISKYRIELIIERFTHYSLYFFLFAIPITGYLSSSYKGYKSSFFSLFNMPIFVEKSDHWAGTFYDAHQILAYLALCFVGLHIGATIMHLVIDKNNILKRII